jgi:hypothetical protein
MKVKGAKERLETVESETSRLTKDGLSDSSRRAAALGYSFKREVFTDKKMELAFCHECRMTANESLMLYKRLQSI